VSVPPVEDRIHLIADLFLGAAHVDGRLAGEERAFVHKLLMDLLCRTELPPVLAAQIDSFDPRSFNLEAAAQRFVADPPMSKRRLLELVAQVIQCDDVLDLEEDHYLKRLGAALGMRPSEYEDLTLEYEIEQARESFELLVSLPPPVPADALR
jgi:uncharacterized tellurite resistance protein B-like protein